MLSAVISGDVPKKTFVQYLNDIRIGHAKKLLIEGRMKISTLSMEAGFNNLSNFIEQFKRSTQMSPSEYQKKVRSKKPESYLISDLW